MEEFRTILGYTSDLQFNRKTIYSAEKYLNGDDLSENLYRLCLGLPLRYGHITTTKPTKISSVAGEKAQTFCDEAIRTGGYKIKNLKGC